MPRNHNPGASTLRSRNRVTNKTRLKIVHGNIDEDPEVWADGATLGHSESQLAFGLDADDAAVSSLFSLQPTLLVAT
jgi:enhancer of polycomb-like protein